MRWVEEEASVKLEVGSVSGLRVVKHLREERLARKCLEWACVIGWPWLAVAGKSSESR